MRILPGSEVERFLSGRRMAFRRAEAVARPILEAVRRRGDRAVAEYARKFDGYDGPLRLDRNEMARAWQETPAELQRALKQSAANIARFAGMQKPRQWTRPVEPGVYAGQIVRPIAGVGCYVPGGRFPLPSTALMTAVPARVAGVPRVFVACPRAPAAVLAAAHLAGVEAVFPVGGVQAMAAFAYGTKSIPRVEKIVGPGNLYVTAAKRLLAGEVGIDFPAGPTEIVLVAEDGNPAWLAADLVAQAEHDTAAAAILLTSSRKLAREVARRVPSRWKNCTAFLARDMDEAVALANRIAPEHLWLADPRWLPAVENAGSVFIGPYSPVAAGDYSSGPNHVLPTSGGARLRGGLSVLDFLKVASVQNLTREGLQGLASSVTTLARAEGLEWHARSIEERFR